jgi:ABC-type Fe3+/spermidine/putrescine transport system ATPase subunit
MDGVGFTVEQHEIIGVLGPSGCGKTTLLRLVAGLEAPDSGQVLVSGKDVGQVPPHLRGMGLMFQEYALFPHRDVLGNVAFGLQMQGMSQHDVARRVAEVLQLVGLVGFEHRDVNLLSGGERQRVALARSLAPRPALLMLDEPMGSLDRALRERLLEELPGILRSAGVTTITVTHDQEESFAIADRLVLLRDGCVAQIGTPEGVYQRPDSAWVARFLGLTNLLEARIVAPGRVETNLGLLSVSGATPEHAGLRRTKQLLIRPEAARLVRDGPNVLTGSVTGRSFRGEHYRLTVQHAAGVELAFTLPAGERVPALGEAVALSLDPRALVLLPSA